MITMILLGALWIGSVVVAFRVGSFMSLREPTPAPKLDADEMVISGLVRMSPEEVRAVQEAIRLRRIEIDLDEWLDSPDDGAIRVNRTSWHYPSDC